MKIKVLVLAALALVLWQHPAHATGDGNESHNQDNNQNQSYADGQNQCYCPCPGTPQNQNFGTQNQNQNQGASGGMGVLSRQSAEFYADALEAAEYEVAYGQLALQRAQYQETRALAQQMVNDHSQSIQELIGLGQQTGQPSEIQLDSKYTRRIEKLSDSRTPDKDYARTIVNDHKSDLGLYRRYAQKGDDPGLRDFAGRQIPIMQDHLAHAEAVDDVVRNQSNLQTNNQSPNNFNQAPNYTNNQNNNQNNNQYNNNNNNQYNNPTTNATFCTYQQYRAGQCTYAQYLSQYMDLNATNPRPGPQPTPTPRPTHSNVNHDDFDGDHKSSGRMFVLYASPNVSVAAPAGSGQGGRAK